MTNRSENSYPEIYTHKHQNFISWMYTHNRTEMSHSGHSHPNRSDNSYPGIYTYFKSEVSSWEPTPKHIRETSWSQTHTQRLRDLTPWYIHLWRETLYTATFQPQSCQGSHTFGTYIEQQHRNIITPLKQFRGAETLGHRFPLPSKSVILISEHRLSNTTETSYPGAWWPKTVLSPSTLDADSSHLGDISFWV